MMQKYQIDTAENKAFLKEMRDGLLSFGHRFPSPGGGSYYLGDDGTPWKERPRETWITSRMTHVYSIGSFLGHEGSEELVDAALKGLRGELKDVKNGGWYAGVTADGDILPNKQCYAHAFVILAATSALLAGRDGAKELLDEALHLYDERFWNEEEGYPVILGIRSLPCLMIIAASMRTCIQWRHFWQWQMSCRTILIVCVQDALLTVW